MSGQVDVHPCRWPDFFPAGGFAALAGISLCWVVGCGSTAIEQRPTFAVTGSVAEAGKPVSAAMLTLYPLSAEDRAKSWPNGYPHAIVKADGTFTISTYAEGDGAPDGDYVVLIQLLVPCPKNAPELQEPDPDPVDGENQPLCDKYQGRFANPESSTWKVKVQGQPVTVPAIDVSRSAQPIEDNPET